MNDDSARNREQTELSICLEDAPQPEALETFWNFLRAYNRENVGDTGHRKLCILARNSQGEVVGGLNGETYYGWLYVDNLAVEESCRKSGLGSRLLKAAEAEAINRGCFAAYLETHSFQALPFYQKHGYQTFGELKDFPRGHTRFYLQKRLDQD